MVLTNFMRYWRLVGCRYCITFLIFLSPSSASIFLGLCTGKNKQDYIEWPRSIKALALNMVGMFESAQNLQ
jgi:hypothetical protein